MADFASSDLLHHPSDALFVRHLYLRLACSRAATIQEALWKASEPPEPLAEMLSIAAAELAYVACAAGFATFEPSRSAAVARRLTTAARSLDPSAPAHAEAAFRELELVSPVDGVALARETADSLAWSCAALRHHGALLEDAEDGNADQHELAWICVIQAAELLMAADRAAIEVREAAG